jgi:nucleotide-binding universal stress UspA family protein
MGETAQTPKRSDTNHEIAPGRWVVGVDGSECSRHAALWATAHADGRAAELQLNTTWSIPTSTAMGPMGAMGPLVVGESFEALEQSAQTIVHELADQLGSMTEVPVTCSVGQGGAASTLLDAASHSDLLVVGSRGRGGFARLVLGSTSTQCATHSTVPVVVIPSDAPLDPATSIVVAVDGSPNSDSALQWAVDFAAPGSTITCVSVWDPTPIALGADQYVLPDAIGLAREQFENIFSRAMDTIDRTDIEVRQEFVEGRARATLEKLASDADLLVMGARGHGAISAAVLGSVSTWLLHHVRRPMVIVPHVTTTRADDVDAIAIDQED